MQGPARETQRTIEDLSGVGQMFEGDKLLGIVRYRLHVSKKVFSVGAEEIDGLRRADGAVLDFGTLNPFDLMTRNAELTLELSDGRRWDCWLQNSNGTLVSRSGRGIYRP